MSYLFHNVSIWKATVVKSYRPDLKSVTTVDAICAKTITAQVAFMRTMTAIEWLIRIPDLVHLFDDRLVHVDFVTDVFDNEFIK